MPKPLPRLPIMVLPLLLLPAAAMAQEAGDAARGEKLFTQCKACHEAEKGVNRVGPTLKGLIGRTVSAVPDYKYSQAMKDFAAANPVWTEDLFLAYIENPRKIVPGTKMVYPGLKKPDDRASLLAFLKTKT